MNVRVAAPSYQLSAAPQHRRSGLKLRLRVWLHRDRLDRLLAEGANPLADRTLALRASQITGPRFRRALAATLYNILDAAEHEVRPRSEIIALRRAQIRDAQDALLEPAERLEAPASIGEHGAAQAILLIHHGESPLYNPDASATVSQYARATMLALSDHVP